MTNREPVGLCTLCPRMCRADRTEHLGYCGVPHLPKVARVGLHAWEEPCISYGAGSGTVFFSGCPLGCVFCQNDEISRGKKGTVIDIRALADEFLHLQDMGAVNINLVTPTHYVSAIIAALECVKDALDIPVVYNCGGYERVETLEMLRGYVDIFLPDIKFFSSEDSLRYAGVSDYFERAWAALKRMYELVGYAVFDGDGHMQKGVLTRHLLLPGKLAASKAIFDRIAAEYDTSRFAISLMSQYFPTENCKNYPEIDRKVTSLEYMRLVEYADSLGFRVGFLQDKTSAKKEYVPTFDYESFHFTER